MERRWAVPSQEPRGPEQDAGGVRTAPAKSDRSVGPKTAILTSLLSPEDAITQALTKRKALVRGRRLSGPGLLRKTVCAETAKSGVINPRKCSDGTHDDRLGRSRPKPAPLLSAPNSTLGSLYQ